MSIQELAQTLRRINEGTIPEDEAKQLLGRIDPVELSLAEQELLKDWTQPQELRKLCEVHLKVLEPQLEELQGKLDAEHPLHTLIAEHTIILGFLEELEKTGQKLQEKASIEADDQDLRKLREMTRNLLDTEKHHQREEDALFPVIEAKGIDGPTRIMRMEHDDLRAKKHELAQLAQEGIKDVGEFKNRLHELASFIVFQLRDHIYKENMILYPAAFDAISEDREWKEIKQKSDQIGYCNFTPKLVIH